MIGAQRTLGPERAGQGGEHGRDALGLLLADLVVDPRAVAAAVVQLVSESFFRIGSERYLAENRTFGIATLMKRHVEIANGRATFTYVGKRAIRQRQIVGNRSLARLVSRHLSSPGARLFRYRDGRRWRDLTSRDVNAYLQETLGVPFSAKDFRTWGGTLEAIRAFVRAPMPAGASERTVAAVQNAAIREVAEQLGNTPAVCRSSYIHPAVFTGWRSGRLAKAVPESDLNHPRKLESMALAFLSAARKSTRTDRALH